MEKFSLLTPALNSRPFLKDWADSIFAQDYRPLEVIFVDDCSKDGTLEAVHAMIPEFEKRDIEIKTIQNKKRQFYASGLRTAFMKSSGMYIGILDSDDKLAPNACDQIVPIYEARPEVTWIYTSYRRYDRTMTTFKNGLSAYPRYGSLLDDGAHGRHTYSHWRTFTRKLDNPEEIFCVGLKSAVDKFMGYRLEEKGIGGFLDRIMYHYRYGVPTSITKTERTIATWKKIVMDMIARRKKLHITPYEIIKL